MRRSANLVILWGWIGRGRGLHTSCRRTSRLDAVALRVRRQEAKEDARIAASVIRKQADGCTVLYHVRILRGIYISLRLHPDGKRSLHFCYVILFCSCLVYDIRGFIDFRFNIGFPRTGKVELPLEKTDYSEDVKVIAAHSCISVFHFFGIIVEPIACFHCKSGN